MANDVTYLKPASEEKRINNVTYIIEPKLVVEPRTGKKVWAFPETVFVDESGKLVCSDYVRRAGLKQAREGKIELFGPEFQSMAAVPDADPGKLWLWKDRLLANDLCHMAGKPGTGKSLLTATFAAKVSVGGPWPHDPDSVTDAPGDVVLCCSEDSPSEIKRRLLAAGADLSRIHLFTSLKSAKPGSDDQIPANLAHVNELGELLDHLEHPRLVIFDALGDLMPLGFNPNQDRAVRAVLDPLRKLAQERGICVLTVGHTSKRAQKDGDAPLGSIAWMGVPRLVMQTQALESGGNVLKVTKSNRSKVNTASRYWVGEDEMGVPRIDFDPKPYAADEAADTHTEDDDDSIGAMDDAPKLLVPATPQTPSLSEDEKRDWARTYLQEGPQNLSGFNRAGRAAGLGSHPSQWATQNLDCEVFQLDDRKEKFIRLPEMEESMTAAA